MLEVQGGFQRRTPLYPGEEPKTLTPPTICCCMICYYFPIHLLHFVRKMGGGSPVFVVVEFGESGGYDFGGAAEVISLERFVALQLCWHAIY